MNDEKMRISSSVRRIFSKVYEDWVLQEGSGILINKEVEKCGMFQNVTFVVIVW